MCKYCKPKHEIKDLIKKKAISHGELLAEDPVSVAIWNDGILNIETKVDDVYTQINIKYCPMCGLRVGDSGGVESDKD